MASERIVQLKYSNFAFLCYKKKTIWVYMASGHSWVYYVYAKYPKTLFVLEIVSMM